MGRKQFLLFPQCFQKVCFPGASKGAIVWEWVKPFSNGKFQTNSDFSNLKECTDDNSNFDVNGGKFSKRVDNNVGK